MKSLVIVFAALLLGSCEKECKTMLVVRDCTGTYLRENGKDYFVCNKDKLASFNDGATVEATFHSIPTCSSEEVACMLYHQNEGPVVVDEVK